MLKPLVMVIDDDKGMLNLLTIIFINNGYKVLTAPNGIAALNLLKNNSPAVIVTDYLMPQLKGNELIELIHKNSTLKNVPAVIITGSLKEFISIPRTGNFQGIIQKPFKVSTIVETVNRLVQKNKVYQA